MTIYKYMVLLYLYQRFRFMASMEKPGENVGFAQYGTRLRLNHFPLSLEYTMNRMQFI